MADTSSPAHQLHDNHRPVKRPALGISSSYKLGAAIRRMRLMQGLTQEELAHKSGISRTWISHIESGHHNVGINTALHLIGSLGYDYSASATRS